MVDAGVGARAGALPRGGAAALASCFDCYVLYSTQYNKDKNTERLVCLHVTTVDSLVQVGQPAPLLHVSVRCTPAPARGRRSSQVQA